MAFVVRRPNGRWEIRESHATAEGPRARTLASFKLLSSDVLDRAGAAARTPFDRAAVVAAARRAGAPFAKPLADASAETLIRALGRGERLRPGLRRLLAERLAGDRTDDSFSMWIGASLEERGRALVDLLHLADRLPKRARKAPAMPRLAPS